MVVPEVARLIRDRACRVRSVLRRVLHGLMTTSGVLPSRVSHLRCRMLLEWDLLVWLRRWRRKGGRRRRCVTKLLWMHCRSLVVVVVGRRSGDSLFLDSRVKLSFYEGILLR